MKTRSAAIRAGFVATLLLLAHSVIAAPTLTVFTLHQRPALGLDRVPATVYYLDDAALLNQTISAGLPADREGAKREALQRLNSADGTAYLKNIGPATEHLVKAWAWGVRALPAVVIEDNGARAVVYGTSDSAQGYAIWVNAAGRR